MTPSIKQGLEGIEEKPPTEPLVVVVPSPSSDWREPFIKYLTTADVSADNTQRERLTHRSKHYVLVEGKLYRKNAKGSYSKNAPPWKKARRYSRRSMSASTTTMRPLEHWSEMLSNLVSIGPQL